MEAVLRVEDLDLFVPDWLEAGAPEPMALDQAAEFLALYAVTRLSVDEGMHGVMVRELQSMLHKGLALTSALAGKPFRLMPMPPNCMLSFKVHAYFVGLVMDLVRAVASPKVLAFFPTLLQTIVYVMVMERTFGTGRAPAMEKDLHAFMLVPEHTRALVNGSCLCAERDPECHTFWRRMISMVVPELVPLMWPASRQFKHVHDILSSIALVDGSWPMQHALDVRDLQGVEPLPVLDTTVPTLRSLMLRFLSARPAIAADYVRQRVSNAVFVGPELWTAVLLMVADAPSLDEDPRVQETVMRAHARGGEALAQARRKWFADGLRTGMQVASAHKVLAHCKALPVDSPVGAAAMSDAVLWMMEADALAQRTGALARFTPADYAFANGFSFRVREADPAEVQRMVATVAMDCVEAALGAPVVLAALEASAKQVAGFAVAMFCTGWNLDMGLPMHKAAALECRDRLQFLFRSWSPVCSGMVLLADWSMFKGEVMLQGTCIGASFSDGPLEVCVQRMLELEPGLGVIQVRTAVVGVPGRSVHSSLLQQVRDKLAVNNSKPLILWREMALTASFPWMKDVRYGWSGPMTGEGHRSVDERTMEMRYGDGADAATSATSAASAASSAPAAPAAYKMLGSGTYGCALTPAIPCADSTLDPARVRAAPHLFASKIMYSRKGLREEMGTNKFTQLFDPRHDFTVGVITSCEADLRGVQQEQLTACKTDGAAPYLHSSDLIYSQIIMDNGGKEVAKLDSSELLDMLAHLGTVFLKALPRLSEAGWMHRDIKPPNMLFNLISKKVSLIDFGIAIRYERAFSDSSIMPSKYMYFPPEFSMFGAAFRAVFDPDYVEYVEADDIMQAVPTFLKLVDALEDVMDLWKATALTVRDLLNGKDLRSAAMQDYALRYLSNKADVYAMGISIMLLMSKGKLNRLPVTDFEHKLVVFALALMHPVAFRRPCPFTAAQLWLGVMDKTVPPKLFFKAVQRVQQTETLLSFIDKDINSVQNILSVELEALPAPQCFVKKAHGIISRMRRVPPV
jgi:hypothetical protein